MIAEVEGTWNYKEQWTFLKSMKESFIEEKQLKDAFTRERGTIPHARIWAYTHSFIWQIFRQLTTYSMTSLY